MGAGGPRLPVLLQAASSLGYGGLAFDLLRTLLALAAVCALGFFALRWLARRGVGGAGVGAYPGLRVLRRLPLEPRKSLYLVRAGKRLLLIGTGGDGPPSLIAELDESALAAEQSPESPGA